jgi:hypothetical protein
MTARCQVFVAHGLKAIQPRDIQIVKKSSRLQHGFHRREFGPSLATMSLKWRWCLFVVLVTVVFGSFIPNAQPSTRPPAISHRHPHRGGATDRARLLLRRLVKQRYPHADDAPSEHRRNMHNCRGNPRLRRHPLGQANTPKGGSTPRGKPHRAIPAPTVLLVLTDRQLSANLSAPWSFSERRRLTATAACAAFARRTLRGAPDAPSRSTEEISHAEEPTKST